MGLQNDGNKHGVSWGGSFFAHHSLAHVNRELCLAVLRNDEFTARYELRLEEFGDRTFEPQGEARLAPLADCAGSSPAVHRLTVRHHWPPNFGRPASGDLVLCQPWEFGSLPREWVTEIDRTVDEVWAYTEHVRQTYIESGVPAHKIHLVPLGIDPERFHPGIEPFDFSTHPQTKGVRPDDYKFLFVGGTIPRKGIDILLDAFDRSFRAGDPVTLIVKDFGTTSFYANQSSSLLIRALQAKPGGARIAYLTDDLSEQALTSLYAACDCLVQPYRGEGYGLPIAEAMACGKPVIVTGAGAAVDFATSDNAYLIPAERRYIEQTHISGMETVGRPSWHEPSTPELEKLLKHVVNNRAQAQTVGERAALDMAAHHTWDVAARAAVERMASLPEGAVGAAFTSYSLPMGLANFGLSALGGLEMPANSSPDEYEEMKTAGLSAARSGDWHSAVTPLTSCLEIRPDDEAVLNALAVAQYRTGERDEALRLLHRGLTESRAPRDLHHNLAYILLDSENPADHEAALEHALAAFHISPEDANLRRTLTRSRDAVLKIARALLRRGNAGGGRTAAKRDARYREAMGLYREAANALNGADASLAAEAAVEIGTTSVVQPEPQRPLISLVMIVKNEERFLRNCLESARGVVDEIVIVDTGSTDGTVAIAEEFGAKVVHHTWSDDFSEARNVSLAHATGEWALWLDADEEVAPGAGPAFRAAVVGAAANTGGFMIEFRNYLQSTTRSEDGDVATHHACRLFRLAPGVRFEGRIHEQNLRSLQALGLHYTYVPGLTLDHFGYCSEVMTTRNKHERFIRMLIREVEECPDPTLQHFHLFNLGNAYFTRGDMANAALYLRRAAERPDLAEEFTSTLFTELATALHHLGRANEGIEVCADADRIGLTHSGIDFARGYCLLHLKRYREAELAFRTALRLGENEPEMARTGDRGTGGYKARYGLALAHFAMDNYAEAAAECLAALEVKPGFAEARYLLGVSLSRQKRWSEARSQLEALLDLHADHQDARRELAHVQYEMGDYLAALPQLEAAAQSQPDLYEANARLAVCYEQSGRAAAACAVYDRLRALAPDSAEVCVNMGRVLATTGADTEALQSYVKAIHMDPGYGNAYFNAGDLLYRLGQYSEAATAYLAGLEVSPEQPSGFFVLANCYVQTGDLEAAALLYERELNRNPQHVEARNNLDLVEGLVTAARAA